MDSTKSLSAKQRLFVVCNVVLGAILLSTAVLSSNGKRNQQEVSLPTLKDNSGAFNLISQETIDQRFVTRMQNISKKSITAYVIAVCDVPVVARDYTIGEASIEPGKVVEVSTPTRTVSDNCGSTFNQPTITVLAVVFEDRTYGGEFNWAKGVLDDRRGNKIQLKRINELLREAIKWPDADKPLALERLKSKIAALPVDEGESPAVRSGLFTAKQSVLYLLGELKQWHQSRLATQSQSNISLREELAGVNSFQEGLSKLISLNEKRISKY